MESATELHANESIEIQENNSNNNDNNSLNLSNLIPNTTTAITATADINTPLINLPPLSSASPFLLPLEEDTPIIASTSILPPFSITTTSSPSLPVNPSLEQPSISLDESNMFKNELTQAYKSSRSAMEWNGLLSWARKVRGPQWDYSTSQYQVDPNSAEYYSGVERKIDPEAEALLLQQQLLQRSTNQNQFYPNNNTSNNNHNNGAGPSTPGNSGRVLGGQLFSNTYNGNNTGVGGNSSGGNVYDSGRPRRTRAAMTGGGR